MLPRAEHWCGKANAAQLAEVPHYFINSHSVHDAVNAATFEQYAVNACTQIFEHTHVAVVAGGTGLYIKAFCEGLDEMPPVPEYIRAGIQQRYKEEGISFLQNELEQKDPQYWHVAEQHNPQRLMRALEVMEATGNSILTYQRKTKVKRPFRILKIGLRLPRPALYENINKRVDEMMKEGLAEEVKALIPLQHLNALQTVGYKELFDFFNNNISLQQVC